MLKLPVYVKLNETGKGNEVLQATKTNDGNYSGFTTPLDPRTSLEARDHLLHHPGADLAPTETE